MFKQFRITRTLLVLSLFAAFILVACSAPAPAPTAEPINMDETPVPTIVPGSPGDLRRIQVQDVRVEVGVGSPIPVNVMVSGSWPDLCAQLYQIEQRINGLQIEITLLATPADPNCPTDNVGLPFGIALPLNVVQLPLGVYMVVVNGVSTSFNWDGQGGEAPVESQATPTIAPAGPIAYIGADNNIWLLDRSTGQDLQITLDATPSGAIGNERIIAYATPRFSSDGTLLAFDKETGDPVASGYEFRYDLLAYDLFSGTTRAIVEDRDTTGFAWKPGTHLLAYTLGVNPNYFSRRGAQPKADLASGVLAVNVDTGESSELVPPSRGYSLVNPVWSADGRFVSFDEVYLMEGRGLFAYYDFEAGAYISWEESIGSYSWSPDSTRLAYDMMTYTPTGTERIWLRNLQGGEPVDFSPDFEPGYAFLPKYSPSGEQIAYFVNLAGPDTNYANLYVQDVQGGQPRNLGQFESAYVLSWSADGTRLLLSAGPYPDQQVFEVDVAGGETKILAQGREPAQP